MCDLGIRSEYKKLRIHIECEVWVEISFLRITVWHQEAYRVVKNGNTEGRIFLSHSHTRLCLFLLTICSAINTAFSYFKNK